VLEIPRLILLLAMLAVASYHDVRTRSVPDYVWMAGGGAGAMLYLLDWGDVDHFVLLGIATGALISLAVWRLFPMGDADALAILAVSVAYPVSFGTVIVPAVVFFGGLVLEHMAAFAYNIRYNTADLLRGRLFSGVDCALPVRIAAFYSVHRRRPHERFTFCAESRAGGRRRISLRTPAADSDYETREGVFVTWAMPALPFMLAAAAAGAAASVVFMS